MPAVSDLQGLRRARRGTTNHVVTVITTDDLHFGMVPQPSAQRLGGPHGQKINRTVPLQVVEDHAVSVALSKGPVIDSEDARDKKFLGSPSIRVDGVDVEYGDREPDEYQAGTRYYNTPEGWKQYPHARLIANTILEMQARAKK